MLFPLLLSGNKLNSLGVIQNSTFSHQQLFKNCYFCISLKKQQVMSTNLQLLTAISPVDGRYRNKVDALALYFSEYALIRYRVLVEIEYFIALCEQPLPQLSDFNKALYDDLRDVYRNFELEDAERVKEIEGVTNHDVKAVEYFIKERFDILGLVKYKEFIHFGLTSQDINNTSVPYSLKDAVNEVYYPILEELIDQLDDIAAEWKDIAMLARTHGQPASPTRLGKEIKVFVERLNVQLSLLKGIPMSAKFGGATGNFNAHNAAYPQINWVDFGNNFVNNILNLDREQVTTQISNYDNLSAIFDSLKRINTVLLDLSRDFWMYIMEEYFKQKIKKGEVGSSAMPHKVNPIDFENAEGNLGIANAIYEHLSSKLPVSRLQRDLTDSTVLRNIGVPIAHTVIAIRSLQKGVGKLLLNKDAIDADLENNWAVVAEAIQTILRREGYPNPYEALKELTRTNKQINAKTMAEFIDQLNVSADVKVELKLLSPQTYTGV
jgi:adenylosuccinate lyase